MVWAGCGCASATKVQANIHNLIEISMATRNYDSKKAGSRKQTKEPRCLSEILAEYFASNSPLGLAYCNRLFKDIFPDTHLAVDLKLLTRKPGRIPVGAFLDGAITRDSKDHFCFIQNVDGKKIVVVRNPHLYKGKCVNVIKKEDMLFLTFNRPHFTKDFTFQDFCREAAAELIMVAGLVGENPKGE